MTRMLLLALALAFQGAPLAERHRAWLEEEVHFLVTESERRRFLELSSGEERERFIEGFWQRRDPTPETIGNEAREQHLARLREADRLFTLVRSRPGRLTERGRVYQLLGPPASREDFTRAGNRLFPLELWQYVGRTERFLPESFYLVFFRRGGFGDYRLWSPTTDGPQALIATHEPGRFHLRSDDAFEQLERVDFELALAVRRLVPGESDDLPNFASESLLANLREYSDLAARALPLREEVRADFTFRRLPVSAVARALFDAGGIPQVHYALEIPAASVSWTPDDDGFRSSFVLAGRMLDEEHRVVDRFEDALEVRATEEEKTSPLSFQGRLILPPGRFRIELTLTNRPGGATEVVTLPVEVPDERKQGVAEILLARSTSVWPDGSFVDEKPFQVGATILSPSPDHVFPPVEAVAVAQIRGFSGDVPLTWRLTSESSAEALWQESARRNASTGASLVVQQIVPLDGLPDGPYRLELDVDGVSRAARLDVRRSDAPSKVRVLSREGLPAGDGRIRHRRGLLLARRGERERAIEELTAAARLLPRNLELHLELAFLLHATGEPRRVVELLRPLEPHHPREHDLLVFLGFASLQLAAFSEATAYLERALAERPGDERLESALAEARAGAERRKR